VLTLFILLLFIGLLVRSGIPEGLEKMAGALLSNLSLLFVPAGVGVMLHTELLGREVLPIALPLVLSTLVTLIVTGWVMQRPGSRGGDT
jgi:holin-like protein